MIYIYDVECFVNFFCATFVHVVKGNTHKFIIHESRDDSQSLHNFVHQDGLKLIGYNNVNYDYHLIEVVYHKVLPTKKMIRKLYEVSQKRIEAERDYYGEFVIPQRDLMKVWHFDPKGAKASSLKWLQINMDFKSVEDNPFKHNQEIKADNIDLILDYNLNDVMATLELYKRSRDKLEMRAEISKEFGIDMGNFSNAKIGEHIVLKLLSDKTGTSIQGLKKCRTPRSQVVVKDCILPQIEFKSKPFQDLLCYYQGLTYKNESLEELCFVLDGLHYYFGVGGLHAARPSGIYYNIHSADVTGYYPSLKVSQGFAPEHFKDSFPEVYKRIAELRSQYPKGSNKNIAYKEAQNACFGKSNNEYSPFYDPMDFLKTTINGQLSLAMLCERLTLPKAARIIMANTDGIEVEVLDEELYQKICMEWEQLFGLKLEFSQYTKLVMRDINNYLGVTDTGKVKKKGVFSTELELHQDHSMRIVPHALEQYIVNGIPVEETITKENSINGFLMGGRAKTGSFVTGDTILPKHLRYYISTDGIVLKKRLKNGDIGVHVGSKVTQCNQWPEQFNNLDRNFYIRETYKILDTLYKKQTSLW